MLNFPRVYSRVQDWLLAVDSFEIRRRLYPELDFGLKVLDIGCGPGTFLKTHGDFVSHEDYVGIDPSLTYVREARSIFPKARFHCGTVSSVSAALGDASFDLVVAEGVLHHVDDSEAQCIVNFALERLRPGGALLTIDPVRLVPQSRVASLVIGMDRGKHVRTAENYRKLLQGPGRRLEEKVIHDFMRFPYDHVSFRVAVER